MQTIYIPTRLLFGEGTLHLLHEQTLPGSKAMIVISNGKSTIENGYLNEVLKQIEAMGLAYEIFNEVEANPLKSTVMKGAKFASECKCDIVIALGGGSVLDASKAICAMAVNKGDLWDYIGTGSGKGKSLTNKPLPLVAITTTAGTGSEIDMGAIITNEETHEKSGFINPQNFPYLSIVDCTLMKTVPPLYTAYQGFDALFHSLEGYISNKANLWSDMYALTAIRNIANNLEIAVNDGNNIEARNQVAFGNTLSGIVMVVGSTTSEHSLEHAMSAYHQQLPHGAGLIMISKAYFTHFIEQHICDDRFIQMAIAMGKKDAKDPYEFIEMLEDLKIKCHVDNLKMSDYGIHPDEFDVFVQNAKYAMSRLFINDRIDLSDQICKEIYLKSYK